MLRCVDDPMSHVNHQEQHQDVENAHCQVGPQLYLHILARLFQIGELQCLFKFVLRTLRPMIVRLVDGKADYHSQEDGRVGTHELVSR